MNARTSILPDFIVPDQELLNILDITDDLEIAENMFSYSLLEKNILLHRASEDKGRINKYGTKLLELCKRCNLFIANGRIFNDQGIMTKVSEKLLVTRGSQEPVITHLVFNLTSKVDRKWGCYT